MAVSFELPADIERNLRQSLGNLNEAAKEAALVELYRQDKLTARELTTALGLTRLETDALLKRHGVTEDLPSDSEIVDDADSLRRLLDR